MTLRARLGVLAAALALLTMTSSASADVSVVRVSSPSPFPIGDCRPDDTLLWNDGPGSESDPSVAINPMNPDNIVAAWVSDTGYGMVSASSFDGGQTWTRMHASLEISGVLANSRMRRAPSRFEIRAPLTRRIVNRTW